jgi:diketogulonate reductase-like aldo/keto reductase
MQSKTLKNGFSLPVVGLGTWTMGGRMEPDYTNDKQDIEAIQKALELGYRHIDTAEGYADGHCEELVGEAIKGFNRDELIIATKVTNTHLKPDDLRRSLDNSLKRLGLDYVDLYMIHSPSDEMDLSVTMPVFDQIKEQGLIKNIGVSNFTVELLKEAMKYTSNLIVSNQIEYSLLTREEGKYGGNHSMESKTVPFCQKNDIFVVAERPIERGLVTEPHQLLDELSEKYDKSKVQIAINWLISKDNVVTIPKSSNREHLVENLDSIGWKMSDEDIKRLDGIQF